MLIELSAGDYAVAVDAERGGSVARLDWRGQAVFRASRPGSILETGCFALVPFCNRIADGRFAVGQDRHRLDPNLPGSDHPHPLHGFGWLQPWSVQSASAHAATIRHGHAAGQWPFAYEAVQEFRVEPDGVTMALSATNLSQAAMPCGLGFHPYFPREADAGYHALHRGEWQTSDQGLPMTLNEADQPIDWWHGAPVGTRTVDTNYTGRAGPIRLTWPGRALTVELAPSDNLPFTTVYTPQGADFFCVEPVSHATDAINRAPDSLTWLPPGQTMTVSVTLRAAVMDGDMN